MWEAGNMATSLATALVTLSLYTLAEAATTVAPAGNVTVGPTEPPVFTLNVSHVESDTSHIEIQWDLVPAGFDVDSFVVETNKKDSETKIISPTLNGTARGYVVEDLMAKTDYVVCVIASVANETWTGEYPSCSELSTIALIRPDSVYILFIVIGYLLLMVLLGIICWKCKMRKLEKDEETGEDVEKEKINPQNNAPAYAAPPNRPHSPIEDHDIPFITPPYDQLSPEEQNRYRKSAAI